MGSRVAYVSLVTSCPCPVPESVLGHSALIPLSMLIIAAIPSLVFPNTDVLLKFVGKGEGSQYNVKQKTLRQIPGTTLLNKSLTTVPWRSCWLNFSGPGLMATCQVTASLWRPSAISPGFFQLHHPWNSFSTPTAFFLFSSVVDFSWSCGVVDRPYLFTSRPCYHCLRGLRHGTQPLSAPVS